MRTRRILLLGVAASLSGFAAEQEHRALAQLGLVDPALVVSWNQTINDIGFA